MNGYVVGSWVRAARHFRYYLANSTGAFVLEIWEAYVTKWMMCFVATACTMTSGHAAEGLSFATGRVAGTDPDGQPNTAIYDRRAGTPGNLLVAPRPSGEPKENLTGFSHLSPSPDGGTLYFQAHAWVTSDAIHKIDLSTRKVSFVTDGDITCVLKIGRFRHDSLLER
jgi:hypothetical protein